MRRRNAGRNGGFSNVFDLFENGFFLIVVDLGFYECSKEIEEFGFAIL